MIQKEKTAKGGSANEVDDYMAALPKDARATLEKLRKTIRAAAPRATEGISWRMPTFKQQGGLVCYAAFKNHCSLFPMSTTIVKLFEDELSAYVTSKGTIQFTVEKPLPVALVKKIVKERIAENEERAARRKGRA